MSDAAPEKAEKKKGGKMPIVIVLGAMLAAGGYFGMQSKGGKGEEKVPDPTLGTVVELEPEFVVNLREREYFLRATVALHVDKYATVKLGGDSKGKKGPSPEMIAIRDAVSERLSSLSVRDLRRPDFFDRLRRVLAADVNNVLALVSHKKEEEKKDDKSKRKKDKDEEEPKDEHKKPVTLDTVEMDPEKLDFPDFDSEEGPVLKVYITGFATQRE